MTGGLNAHMSFIQIGATPLPVNRLNRLKTMLGSKLANNRSGGLHGMNQSNVSPTHIIVSSTLECQQKMLGACYQQTYSHGSITTRACVVCLNMLGFDYARKHNLNGDLSGQE